MGALRQTFFATPYRPTGVTTAARVLVRAVDQAVWLDAILDRMPPERARGGRHAAAYEIALASAGMLEHAARLLDDTADEPPGHAAARARLDAGRDALRRDAAPVTSVAAGDPATGLVSALEPGFRAQELSFAVATLVDTIELVAAARRRTWWQLLLGLGPTGVSASVMSAQARLGAHLRRNSVWLHNSLRAAAALGIAVFVIQLVRIDHSFWVVFGTLSILRSSALSTGQDAVRALAGTAVGLAVGGTLTLLLGGDTTAYWVALPPAVLFAGLAPAAISFAAGQAGFTIVLMVLYGIIAPAGFTTGLVRVEDVAIGSAVSVLVGGLFWPRGAGAQLGQTLAEAYADAAHVLLRAIEAGLAPNAHPPARTAAVDAAEASAASARRLDDALRTFLADRGAKHVSLADVMTLVNGVTVLRLTAAAITDVWARAERPGLHPPAAARDDLLTAGRTLCAWYARAADALAGGGPMPTPLENDPGADARLADAVRPLDRDLAVAVVWTADHIDVARRLQGEIAGPAGAVATVLRGSRAGRALRTSSGDVRTAPVG